jgi:uncharacterized protein YkwD
MRGRSGTARFAAVLAAAAVLLGPGLAGAAPAAVPPHALPRPLAGLAGEAPAAVPPPALPPPLASRGTVAYDAAGTARLYTLVNTHRTAKGLAPLRVHEGLAAIARGWTAHMATAQVLSHNDALFTRARHTALRIANFGENVAYSSVSVAGANKVLMESPHHLANIENGAFAVGGFAVYTDTRGWYWVTEDFGTAPRSAIVPAPAPAPAPRPAPVRTAAPRPARKPAAKPVAKPVVRPAAGAVAAPYVRPAVAVARTGAARVDASAAPAARTTSTDTARAASAGDVPHGVSPLAWLAGGLIALVVAGLLGQRRRDGSARLAG